MKKTTILLLSTILTLTTCFSAKAVNISVFGEDFSISTITGTYKDNEELLRTQPWWTFNTVAARATSDVGSELGFQNRINTLNAGPLFAWSPTGLRSFNTYFAYEKPLGEIGFASGSLRYDQNYTFAVAEPVAVPEPVTIFGSLMVLTFGVFMHRHRGLHSRSTVGLK